jgi:hypothetical protein
MANLADTLTGTRQLPMTHGDGIVNESATNRPLNASHT